MGFICSFFGSAEGTETEGDSKRCYVILSVVFSPLSNGEFRMFARDYASFAGVHCFDAAHKRPSARITAMGTTDSRRLFRGFVCISLLIKKLKTCGRRARR